MTTLTLTTKEMTQVLCLSPVHKFLATRIEETAWEKPLFQLFPFGNGQLFALTAPNLRILGILDGVLQQVSLSSQLGPMCDGRPFRLSAFSPLGGSRPLFLRFPFSMGRFNWWSLWLAGWLGKTATLLLQGRILCLPCGFSGANPCWCRQMHLTRYFSHAVCTIHIMHITLHGSSVCMRASFHLHVIHDEPLIVRSLLLPRSVFSPCFSLLFTSPLLFHTLPALWNALFLPCGQRQGKHPLRLRPKPNRPWRLPLLRDLWNDIPGESGDIDTEPSYLCDAELDDETIGKRYLHHCSFRSEEEPADAKTSLSLSWRKSLLPGQSSFHTTPQERLRPVHDSLVRVKNQSQVAKWKTSLERQN